MKKNKKRYLKLVCIIFLTIFFNSPSSTMSAKKNSLKTAVSGHPRLWLRAEDIPRLRSWAVSSNPIFQEGLLALANQATYNMDNGLVPNEDLGTVTYEDYPTEMYAELFAFMSLVSKDSSVREDYAERAKTLLMYVMNIAALGVADTMPFRDPEFAINDRSRWQGEGFGLTVDWIYPYLTSNDKAVIRKVFLRWISENLNSAVTGYDHPEPMGVVNNPILLQDTAQLRWAANNYFTAHMRNIGLMAMALDSADDPGDTLHNYLGNATGAWLYMIDFVMRKICPGGLFPEGFEYAPQTIGYTAQFLLALFTAGQADPQIWGSQVDLKGNPFWDQFVTATIHSFSPSTIMEPNIGEVHEPAWYGDGLTYTAPDFIEAFGPLGVYDYNTGNTNQLETIRWIQTYLAPGGPDELTLRAEDSNFFRNAILYFMLFDPAAPSPKDPRTSLPLTWYASGLGRILARTSWNTDASWFTYKLSWNSVDHQFGDGNQFEFYRNGEWLTKERTGYDLDYGAAENHNTLALQNDPPENNDPGEYRNINWLLGSQWAYVSSGNPTITALNLSQDFVYITGDATSLYNSVDENSTDIIYANRSIVWLKPDLIIIYDRAESKTSNRFKRFWLNLPVKAEVSGNLTTMTTVSGQRLFINTLLPSDAEISSELDTVLAGDVAEYEPMNFRLRIEDPTNPLSVRFLNVLQGADPNSSSYTVQIIQSNAGVPYSGVLVNNTVILFPVDMNNLLSSFSYNVPTSNIKQIITGLTPNVGYSVAMQHVGSKIQVTIGSGGIYKSDSSGVLIINNATKVKDIDEFPIEFKLFPNYPNPFNPTTTIKYSIPKQSYVTLKVYDLLGREIQTIVNEEKPPGNYEVEFHIQQTTNNKQLSSGVYFYRIRAGSFNQVRKMLLIK